MARGRFEHPVVRLVVVGAVTVAGLGWLLVQGPIEVVRGSTPIDEIVPLWYNLIAFPVLGFLLSDLLVLYSRGRLALPTVELAVQIVLIVGLSAIRIGLQVPLSGHGLLLAYFVGRRLAVGPRSRSWYLVELLCAVVLLGLVIHRKLLVWADPTTLAVGMGMGFLLALASYLVSRRTA